MRPNVGSWCIHAHARSIASHDGNRAKSGYLKVEGEQTDLPPPGRELLLVVQGWCVVHRRVPRVVLQSARIIHTKHLWCRPSDRYDEISHEQTLARSIEDNHLLKRAHLRGHAHRISHEGMLDPSRVLTNPAQSCAAT